ncbi:MAG TPA: hypothetical protein VFV54_10680 [Thermoanaerobaculia bacterium]|nr:hypothetical protein [Thermoanaerobaculia bacterium]
MPTDVITFAVDAAAPPELALAAEGLAAGLRDLGRSCEVLVDPWPETLSGRPTVIDVSSSEAERGRWRLDGGAGPVLELTGPSAPPTAIPFALPALPARRRGCARLLVIGADSPRRSRMLLKLFDALQRRPGCRVIVWRDLSDEVARQKMVAEVHPEVNASELARLLGSVDVLVEVADEALPEAMLLAGIGRAAGLPIVVPEGFPGERWPGIVEVREWGGDAFADAALAAAKRARSEDVAASVRKEAAQRLVGAIFS